LQLRTNNGDDRRKAHDVFPAVCYPDLFWKTVRDDIDAEWHLFCPHEIKTIKGYSLEDAYGEDWEVKYRDCVSDERISRRVMPIKELLRLIIKSSVETGTPFTFNRDHVNRMNPNAHHGVIYC
jgi:ribonucleoside-diphosphate reductase alpha chain